MKMQHIPFATTDWASVPREEESAKAGQVVRRMVQFGYVRVRRMGLKPGYLPSMRYQVADNVETHRSRSQQAPPVHRGLRCCKQSGSIPHFLTTTLQP